MSSDICPTVDMDIVQRNSRTIRVYVRSRNGEPFELDDPAGTGAVFLAKENETDADGVAKITKKSTALGGGDAQIAFVSVPVKKGGPLKIWAMDIKILVADTTPMAPGPYFYQVDVVPADPTQRFTAVQGTLRIKRTYIQT